MGDEAEAIRLLTEWANRGVGDRYFEIRYLEREETDPALAQELALDAEERAQSLISNHVRGFRGNMARAELAACYIAARAYVLHNRMDEVTLAALNERADELAQQFGKMRDSEKL